MVNEEALPIKIPDVLFQYCEGNAVEIFEKRRIKSSIPSTLNDPFEWKPSVDEDVTPEQIWNTMTKLHRKSPLPKPPTRLVVAKMKSNIPDAAQSHQAQFGTDLEEHTRIICLSQRNDGILMWAHYADRHKGFVIGFRSEVLRRNHPHSEFLKVHYGLQRPLVPHPYVAPPDKDQLITAVSQKSLEWKYEEEWRLLINVTHLRRDQDPANTNLYLPIPPEAIDQVIFGSRCSDPLVSRIETALESTPGFYRIRRFRARLDPKLFRILVEKL
jgi:Protein of unknown function (DUF2971)